MKSWRGNIVSIKLRETLDLFYLLDELLNHVLPIISFLTDI